MTNAAVLDLVNLSRDLDWASKNAQQVIDRQVLAPAAEQIKTAMMLFVPVDTGNLKRSIVIQASPGRYVIGPNGVPYASYVEFGTGIRGEFPTAPFEIRPRNAKALRFIVNGKPVYAKKVTHPGQRAKPYVRPAARAFLQSLGPQAADVGVQMITKPEQVKANA